MKLNEVHNIDEAMMAGGQEAYATEAKPDAYTRDQMAATAGFGRRPREHDTGDDEPKGVFTVVIDGRDWKTATSNEAFRMANAVAHKHPGKRVQVRWPTGQLNTVAEGLAMGMEEEFVGEPEHDGSTFKNSLHTIHRVAVYLNKNISDDDDIPEWVAEKMGAAKGMLTSVMQYLISEKEMHHGEADIYEQGVAEGWKDKVAGGALALGALGGIGALQNVAPNVTVQGQQFQLANPGTQPDDAKLVTTDDGKKVYAWKTAGQKNRISWLYRPVEQVKEQGVAEGSNELYQKAIQKYARQVANDYLGGGNDYLYGANKFDSEMFGVDPKQAEQDFDRLFAQLTKPKGVAEGLNDTQKKIEDTINKLEDRLKHAKSDEQWDRISARIERLQAGLKRSKQGVAEDLTKLPSGDYQNSHTGVRSSKPPAKKKRGEKTWAEWDAIEKAKKEKGVAEGVSDVVKGVKRAVKGKTDPTVAVAHRSNEYIKAVNTGDKDAIRKTERNLDRVNKVTHGKIGEQGVAEGNYSDEANPIRDDGNEPPDYAAMYENKLVEFAGGMGTGSVATAPGVGKGSNVGSLFGGSYSQKNSPFKKTKAKKESVIKR